MPRKVRPEPVGRLHAPVGEDLPRLRVKLRESFSEHRIGHVRVVRVAEPGAEQDQGHVVAARCRVGEVERLVSERDAKRALLGRRTIRHWARRALPRGEGGGTGTERSHQAE